MLAVSQARPLLLPVRKVRAGELGGSATSDGWTVQGWSGTRVSESAPRSRPFLLIMISKPQIQDRSF